MKHWTLFENWGGGHSLRAALKQLGMGNGSELALSRIQEASGAIWAVLPRTGLSPGPVSVQ